MGAATLHCPTCGAAITGEESSCRYCSARLATVACPSCFGMMFSQSRHCPHCGSEASRGPEADRTGLTCPDCATPLVQVMLGDTPLSECARCFGLWLDTKTFEAVCAQREKQAAVLGKPAAQPLDVQKPWKYLPCPRCRQLMHRINFARQSGVIIDICRDHGVWFEREELRRIVEFIRGGGLTEAREIQLRRLESERKRLETQQRTEAAVSRADPRVWGASDAGAMEAISAVFDLAGLFTDAW